MNVHAYAPTHTHFIHYLELKRSRTGLKNNCGTSKIRNLYDDSMFSKIQPPQELQNTSAFHTL